MEEQREEKYFHFENIGKNIVTTIIGCGLMALSVTAVIITWFFPNAAPPIPYTPISVVFVIGFILLFMRDRAKDYVDIFIKRKIDK